MSEALQKLTRARAGLVTKAPFFGVLSMRQEIVERAEVETMATDGAHVFFNEDFVLSQTIPELEAVLAHEALHPAFHHHLRRGERDFETWNEACDFAINPILRDGGFKLPDNALIEARFDGLKAEAIYTTLMAEKPGGNQGGDNTGQTPSIGGMGAVLDAPADMSEEEREQDAEQWQVATMTAANMARAAGSLPDAIGKRLTLELNPPESLEQHLQRFLNDAAKTDYTWQRPNRRFIAGGMYLPSMHSEKLPPVAIVIDSSPSMPEDKIRQGVSDALGILDSMQPDRIELVVHGSSVLDVQELQPGDTLQGYDIPMGIGTRFAPVCDHINESGEDYACVIWFTDMEAWDWNECNEPAAPVLFVDYDTYEKSAPIFGEVVNIG